MKEWMNWLTNVEKSHMNTCICLLFQHFSPRLTESLNFDQAAGNSYVSLKYLLSKRSGREIIDGKCMRRIICPKLKWPTVTKDFKMAKLAILTWRYLYVIADLGHMQFTKKNTANLQKYCLFSDHTNVTCNLQLLSFVQRIIKVCMPFTRYI